MNLGIISIGKLKNSPLLELQNDYKKRILKLGKKYHPETPYNNEN